MMNIGDGVDHRNEDAVPVTGVVLWGKQSHRNSVFGRIRKYSSLSMLEKILFLITSCAVLVSVGLFAMSFKKGDSEDKVFTVVVIINGLWIMFYLFHGVLIESFFELSAMCTTLMLLYAQFIANYIVESEPQLYKLNLAVIGCSSILTLPVLGISFNLVWNYYSRRNLIFRIAGGDLRKQRMCMILLSAQSLLTFDVHWTLVCLILVFQNGFAFVTVDEILCVTLGPIFIILWGFIGYFGMRFENKWLTWIFAVGSLSQPAYIVYLFFHSSSEINFKLDILNITLYISGVTCLLSHVALGVLAICSWLNYGKGLAQEVYGSGSSRMGESQLFTYTAGLLRSDLENSVDPNQDETLPVICSRSVSTTRLLTPASQNRSYSAI